MLGEIYSSNRINKKSRNGNVDEETNSLMADTLITGTTLVEKESRSIGDVPIGGIVSWAKSLAGVPNLAEGWVECDGSVLVDALSPLNGQTIPDLNGDNRFLRGASTSGGTGGSETHDHDLNDQGRIRMTNGTDEYCPTSADTGAIPTTFTSTLPTYYEIVWIMRIR
jgi:hypothetical protein